SQSLEVSQPLYKQLKLAIEKRIREEEWPADFQVPKEEALAQEFSASTLTVRRALRELQSAGMLARIQGRGTFVVGPRMQCAIFELPDVSEEIGESGGVHTSEVIALYELPKDSPLMSLMHIPGNGRVFHSRLLHREDGT